VQRRGNREANILNVPLSFGLALDVMSPPTTMATPTPPVSAELPCHACGFDLRAHPPDGNCPECGASVAEARRIAAIPRRPRWRDADPRWRRRVVAGMWILVLLPVIDASLTFGWAAHIPARAIFDSQGAVRSIDETLAAYPLVYQPLLFCMGVVLLFAKERGRRGSPLDWTRRWGVLCSYVVFLLSAVNFLLLGALVLCGIAALLQSLPLKHQHPMEQFFVSVSWGYLRYGPYPKPVATIVLYAFSSATILLACVRLFDALRRFGSKYLAAIVPAPLMLFALVNLWQVGRYFVDPSSWANSDLYSLGIYFRPGLLAAYFEASETPNPFLPEITPGAVATEAAKWGVVLTIAVWLSIGQIAAWRRRIPSIKRNIER
jgi:hypothetical protein